MRLWCLLRLGQTSEHGNQKEIRAHKNGGSLVYICIDKETVLEAAIDTKEDFRFVMKMMKFT